jgi:GST-like protein
MIDLYTAPTSNGQRAAIMLEESGLEYRVHRVDLRSGEQRRPEYLAVNPAGMIPAIVDHDAPGGAPLALSQSGAIVLYLAERSRKLLPADPVTRAHALQWFMHACSDVAGASSALFLQSMMVPDKSAGNVTFFEERVLRFLGNAEAQLERHEHLAGELSVADVALYPVVVARMSLVEKADRFPALLQWAGRMAARETVARGMAACG